MHFTFLRLFTRGYVLPDTLHTEELLIDMRIDSLFGASDLDLELLNLPVNLIFRKLSKIPIYRK